MKLCHNHGFSLVELSVVVVVIGVITVSVIGGEHLVQQARLQNVIKNFMEYDSAIERFKEKFKYYPGDYPDASVYWSDTENGNGNWQINASVSQQEDLNAWEHLALAAMIEGHFNGIVENIRYDPGVNAPASSMKGGFEIVYVTSHYDTSGNAILLGRINAITGHLDQGLLDVVAAQSLDRKLDDGDPDQGSLYVARGNGGSGCMDADYNAASAQYDFSDRNKDCRLLYWLNKE